jgi:hypothetical protein
VSLLLTYSLECLSIILTCILAGLTGVVISRKKGRVGRAFAILAVALFCSPFLFDRFPALTIPLAITEDLLKACGFLLLGVAYVESWNRSSGRILCAVLSVLSSFYVLLQPVSLLFVGQEYSDSSNRYGENHILQSHPSTCVPACCASLLLSMGIPATEGEMAVRCRTNPLGTSWSDAVRALREAVQVRKRNIQFQFLQNLTVEELSKLSPPGILPVEVGERRHAVMYLGMTEDQTPSIRIGDPLIRGVRNCTPAQLLETYLWERSLLRVGKDAP